MSADSKKVANNILDFLIDPTRIPVQDRVYFRPEEILKNETYEKAKADACVAYKDQKHNADFYPQKNRSLTREANIMDRKSLIASMDVLSRNFSNPSDPFAVSLRTMAKALSQMEDETLQARLASEAPDLETTLVEAKKKAKTFKCPECGTKVLEQTGYCVKCKKKVKKADDETCETPEEEKAEEKDSFLLPGQKDVGERFPGSSAMPGGGKIKSIYDKHKDEIGKSPWMKELFEGLLGKKAAEDVVDFWTKEASDKVANSLLTEVLGMYEEEDEEDEEETAATASKDCPMPKEEEEDSATTAAEKCPMPEKKEEEVEAKKEECPMPKKDEEEVEAAKKEECPMPEKKEEEYTEASKKAAEEKKEEEKEAVSDANANKVDTDVLASVNFAGIEIPMSSLDDVGDMSADEKANLAKLF